MPDDRPPTPTPAAGRRAVLRAAAGLAAALALPAAAAAQSSGRRPVVSLLELRRRNVVVQDFDLSCGAAAIATILNFQHGEDLTERQVTRALIDRPEYLENPDIVRARFGFSLLDLKRFVERLGYEGIGFGRLDLAELGRLAPAIVPVNTRGLPHFVVVKEIAIGSVFLADPAFGNRSLDVDRFERAWLEAPEIGRVAFVVRRRDGRPPPDLLRPSEAALARVPGAAVRAAMGGL
jgi:predicted double-glycine peptidase